MHILVTGGAGYIGSHTCVELLEAGYQVTVIDNLSNSKQAALRRVSEITGRELDFVRADLRDRVALAALFRDRDLDAVVHFAGRKAVGESTQIPLEYYENNIGGTLALGKAMAEARVKKIVFSSSATVYGDPTSVPIREDFPTCPTNPWAPCKITCLVDLAEVKLTLVQTERSLTGEPWASPAFLIVRTGCRVSAS